MSSLSTTIHWSVSNCAVNIQLYPGKTGRLDCWYWKQSHWSKTLQPISIHIATSVFWCSFKFYIIPSFSHTKKNSPVVLNSICFKFNVGNVLQLCSYPDLLVQHFQLPASSSRSMRRHWRCSREICSVSLHRATRWVSFEHVSQRTWGFFFRGADWLVKFVKSRVKGKVWLIVSLMSLAHPKGFACSSSWCDGISEYSHFLLASCSMSSWSFAHGTDELLHRT